MGTNRPDRLRDARSSLDSRKLLVIRLQGPAMRAFARVLAHPLHPYLLRWRPRVRNWISGFGLAGDIRGADTYRRLMLQQADVRCYGNALLAAAFNAGSVILAAVAR